MVARGLVLSALLCLAAGCAVSGRLPPAADQTEDVALERLVAGQRYQKALDYLDEQDGTRPGETSEPQRQRLALLISELEQGVAEEATALVSNDDLLGAITLVNRALGKIPASGKLQGLRRNLVEKREGLLAETERNLLLSRAEFLLSQLEGYGEQARLRKPSFSTRWRISRMEDSLAYLHADLLVCSQQPARGKDDPGAKCRQMAERISDFESLNHFLASKNHAPARSAAVAVAKKTAPARSAAVAVAKKTVPAPSSRPSFGELEKKLQEEIGKGELLEAYDTLAKLQRTQGEKEHLASYQEQLDEARESLIARHLQEGSGLYRKGKISEARQTWGKVLELDPDNQTAIKHISRADKVLSRLSDLQKPDEGGTAGQ